MKKEDIKEGVCYTALHVTSGGTDRYVFIAKGDNKNVPYLYVPHTRSYNTAFGVGCLIGASFKDYDEATADERAHLELCISENKYIPYESKVYEIY